MLQHIYTHYDTDISLMECAEKANIDPYQLSRLFKALTGLNFIDYVIHCRMDAARRMLLDPELKLQAIADKLRYNNVQGFIRVFKKTTGVTPGQFRRGFAMRGDGKELLPIEPYWCANHITPEEQC